MYRLINRLVLAAAAAACLLSPAQAGIAPVSRPLTVDDIVGLEAFGRASLSPGGRWAVYEKRGSYDTIPRFDYAQRSPWAIMDLWVADVLDPASPPVLLAPGHGPGLLRVAWSPGGGRLLIYRFTGGRFEAGVVSMPDRSVHWTGLVPEVPPAGASVEWLSEDEVLVMTRPDGSLPRLMRYFSGSQDRISEAWTKTSAGQEASRTVISTAGGVASTEQPEPEQALVRLNVRTGSQQVLVSGYLTDFAVSLDHRTVALVQGGGPLPISPDDIVQAESPRRQRLSLIDLSRAGEITPMPGRDIAPGLLRWSADSAAVLTWSRADGQGWPEGALTATGRRGTALFARNGLSLGGAAEILRGVRADWIGGTPVVLARPDAGGRADWYALSAAGAPHLLTGSLAAVPGQFAASGANDLHLFADGALWRMTVRGLTRLTAVSQTVRDAIPGDPELVARLKVNEAPRRTWYPAFSAEGRSLVFGEADTPRLLGGEGPADTRALAVSPEAAMVLTRNGLVETLSLRTSGGDRPLDTVNARLANVDLPAPKPIHHLDALGRETQSWLFLPPGGAAAAKGVIVQVYPGTTESGFWSGPLTLTYGIRAEVLAAAGFAVLSPSMPADPAAPKTADFHVESVDLAVDAALAAWPGLPKDRTVVVGHSFGGVAALEIAARSTRYRAYVASSALTDMFGGWGEFDAGARIQPEDGFQMRSQQGWVEAGQGQLGASPWEDPGAYVAASPYLDANRITAPVLLLTADMDYVPMSHAERIFSVLYRNGGQARLVTYWGEHHALWSPANIRDRYGQILAWFEAALGEITPQAPAAPPRPGPSLHRPPPP